MFDLERDVISQSHNFLYITLFGAPVGDDVITKIFGVRKLQTLDTVQCCFHNDTFSCSDRTSVCDGHTDGQTEGRTQGHSIYCGGIASRGKNDDGSVENILGYTL